MGVPKVQGNQNISQPQSLAAQKKDLLAKLEIYLKRAEKGPLVNPKVITNTIRALLDIGVKEGGKFEFIRTFYSSLGDQPLRRDSLSDQPSRQDILRNHLKEAFKQILSTGAYRGEPLSLEDLFSDIIVDKVQPRSSTKDPYARVAKLWQDFQAKPSPERTAVNSLLKELKLDPAKVTPKKLLEISHFIKMDFPEYQIATNLVDINVEINIETSRASSQKKVNSQRQQIPVLYKRPRRRSVPPADIPLYSESVESALKAWHNQDIQTKVKIFLGEKGIYEIDRLQPEQIEGVKHELTARFLAEKAEIEAVLGLEGFKVNNPKNPTPRELLDNASILAKELPNNSLVRRLVHFQTGRVGRFITASPDTQIAKVPLQGQLIEVPAWKILNDLRVLANNPHVSQVEFVNEVIELSTVMFDRISPNGVEVEASFIEVNGETLFSRKSFTEGNVAGLDQIKAEFGPRFEALHKSHHNHEISNDVYERSLEQLRKEFSARRIELLGKNSFELKLPQIRVGEGNGPRSFDIKIRFFVSSPIGELKAEQVKYFQHHLHQIMESFIRNNVSLEQNLRDPLLTRKAHSREWAIFKLERLKQFYISQGKNVSMGIFDADYFKNFNAGGNYLLGDDAISILNLTAEKTVRVEDQVELMRNGGDEVSILFVGPDLNGAKAAVGRINKVLALVASVPLTEQLTINHPAVKQLAKEMSISAKELTSLIRTAEGVRGDIKAKIKAGKFRNIKTVAQFTEKFCKARQVKDVARVGESLLLDGGKVEIAVDAKGQLIAKGGSQAFEPQQIRFGESYKVSLFGKDYVVVAEKKSGSFSVYHDVSGLQISGGVGNTIEEATAGLMKAKKEGKGKTLISGNQDAANAAPAKAPRPIVPEVNTTLYEKFGIAENINKVWSELQRSQREGSLMMEHEAVEVYQLVFEQTFGKEVELKAVQELRDTSRSLRIGDQVYEVDVKSADPLVESAAQEFTGLIQQAEKARQHKHVIENAGGIDPRTGLANMSAARKSIGKMLEQVKVQGKGQVRIHFFDMNEFKTINTLYQSYPAADGLVEVIAEAYKLAAADLIKGDYTFARLMGDEFLVAGKEVTPESLIKMNQVLEIMFGVDPGADPSKLRKLTLDAEGKITLESKEELRVSQEELKIVEKVRAKVVEKIQLGEVKGFNFSMLQEAITATRTGRNGQAVVGLTFSGGTVEVTAEQVAGADSPKLEKVTQMGIEQAGQRADAAKLERKAENGKHEIKTEGLKLEGPKTDAPVETAREEGVMKTAKKISLKPIETTTLKATDFKSESALLEALAKLPKDKKISFETAEGMRIIAPPDVVKTMLTKTSIPVQNSQGGFVSVLIDKKDLEIIQRKLVFEMYPEAKESLEAKGRKLAGRGEDFKKKYEDALGRIKGAIELAAPGIDAGAEIEKLKGSITESLVAQKAQLYFRDMSIQQAEKALAKELAEIDPKLPRQEFEHKLAKAVEKAQKRMMLFNQKAYLLLLDKVRRLDAQNKSLAELPAAEIEKVFYELALKNNADISRLTDTELKTEFTQTAEALKAQLNPRGKGAGAWMEYLSHGALMGSGKMKMAAVGVNMGKGALMGAIIEIPFSIIQQYRATGGWTAGQTLKDMAHGALGFAQFEAMSTAAKAFMGMSELGAMGVAIGLPTLWSLRAAPFDSRGVVLSVGAVNLGAFMGTAKGAGALLTKIPMPGWLKGPLALAAGFGAGKVATEGLDYLMQESETIRFLVDNPVTQFFGDVGATASTPLTVYTGGQLLAGVGIKFGYTRLGARLAGIGANLKNATPLFLAITLANPSSEFCQKNVTGDLVSLASGKPMVYFEEGYNESRARFPMNLYLTSKYFHDPTILKSATIWQMAVEMYKNGENGYLKTADIFKHAWQSGGDAEEIADLTRQIQDSLSNVDYNNSHSIKHKFEKFKKTIDDERYFTKAFGTVLMGALKNYMGALRNQRGLLDEDLSPAIRQNLRADYVAFKEQKRYAMLKGQMEQKAKDIYSYFAKERKTALGKIQGLYQTALGKIDSGDKAGSMILGLQYENTAYNFKRANSSPLPPAERKAFISYLRKVAPNGKLSKLEFVEYYTRYLMEVKGPAALKQELIKKGKSPQAAAEHATLVYQNPAQVKPDQGKASQQLLLADLPAAEVKPFKKYLEAKYGDLSAGVKSDFYLLSDKKLNLNVGDAAASREIKQPLESKLFIGVGTALFMARAMDKRTKDYKRVLMMALKEHNVVSLKLGQGFKTYDQLKPYQRNLESFINARGINNRGQKSVVVSKESNKIFNITINGTTTRVQFYSDGGFKLLKAKPNRPLLASN